MAEEADKVIEPGSKDTDLGMDANLAAALSYLWIVGLIFIFIEKKNKFVRFHAFQSVFGGLALGVITTIVGMIPVVNFLTCLVGPAVLALLIYMAYQAYKGQMFKLPVIGNFAEEQANK